MHFRPAWIRHDRTMSSLSMLTVGTYNHQGGGIDGGSQDRLDRQLDLLAAAELDALLCTEATHWFDHGRRGLHHAAARLGMRPLWVRAPRHDCNLVVFVRPDRLQVLEERHERGHPWWHAQARVVVRVAGLHEPLWLVGSHFAPFNPEIRLVEARATAELGDRPTVLAGDFNDEGLGDLPTDWAALPAHEALRHADVYGESAATLLHRAGFVDVSAALFPDPRDRTHTAGMSRAPVRCDRIYVSERLSGSPVAHRTVTDADSLSDHRLVVAELALS
jgi:endonuclease/exonuclease/phosphatase family metal-dependent hydrolase